MAIDFPGSPTIGQEVTIGAVVYKWDGTKWTAVPAGIAAGTKIEISNTKAEIIDTGSDGRFVVTTEGTERVRVTAAGLMGVGTTAPSTPLEVAGAVGNGVISDYLSLYYPGNFGGGGSGPRMVFKANNIADTKSTYAGIWSLLEANGVGTHSGKLVFGTTSAGSLVERLRIDESGRLLVGIIASPAHQLQVSTDSAGKPSTNTWTIVSDERIKEEIELADLDLCYEAVKSIPLKRFKWKDEVYTEEQVRDRRKLGWIAQDVEAVFPKAVGTYEFKYNQVFEETIVPAIEEVLDDEGNVTTPAQPERIENELISEDVIEDCRDLNSDQLYAAMYGAIQKMMIKVEALETEIASLKSIG